MAPLHSQQLLGGIVKRQVREVLVGQVHSCIQQVDVSHGKGLAQPQLLLLLLAQLLVLLPRLLVC